MQTRPLLVRRLIAAALVGLHVGMIAAPLNAAAPGRPNMLFAFADDWGRHAGIYGELEPGGVNDIVQTPHFDRLAREGVLFRHAFVNAPSCTPCRSSLLSGQHFWRTGRGAILQGARWDASIPAWPLLLRDAGYSIGKSHKVWSPGQPVDAPFGGRDHAFETAGRRFNGFSQNATRLVQAGQTVEQAREQLLEEVRRNFTAFLDARDARRPFCYWFGPTNVHRKWVAGSGRNLWGLDPDALEGKLPPFLPDVPVVRQDLADYFGEIRAFDAALGVLLDVLAKRGERDNTLVIVSGDHGAPGFPHGKCNLYDFGTQVPLVVAGAGVQGHRVVDDFVSLPDVAPTILEAAGIDVPNVMTARSLWPVLKSTADGLVDRQRTFVLTGRERHVAEARAGMKPYPQRAIRTARFLFVINFRPDRYPLGDPHRLDGDDAPSVEQLTENTRVTLADEDAGPTKAWIVSHRQDARWRPVYEHAYGRRPREELFDPAKDPHQMRNVAADPDYAEVVDRLRQQLLGELRRTGDPRLEDDGAFFENPPLAGPIPADAQPRRRRK